MKYLTAVLQNEEVQKYISENEDSAFEYLKENLVIANIYESVIANMPKFINTNSDLTSIYEAIREYTANYVMAILSENFPIPFAETWRNSTQKAIDETVNELAKAHDFTKEQAGAAVQALKDGNTESYNKLLTKIGKGTTEDSHNIAGVPTDGFIAWAGKYLSSISTEANNYWECVKQVMVDRPQLTIPAAIIGFVGIVYLSLKKKTAK
ncbi:MAG: hypothetical protein IPH62_19640 [Ignavibacteriae bacterium]|nr:hypothetical protein [Ignavibacteriota bacterium]